MGDFSFHDIQQSGKDINKNTNRGTHTHKKKNLNNFNKKFFKESSWGTDGFKNTGLRFTSMLGGVKGAGATNKKGG